MQNIDEAHILKESQQFLTAINILQESNKWKINSEKDISVWQMDVQGRVVIKASSTIKVPFEKAMEFFRDPLHMKKIQQNIQSSQIVWSKDNLHVIHGIMKMPGPVSNRQIVAVNTFKQNGNKFIAGDRSCNFPVKLDKDAELAHIYVGAFICEKIDAQTIKITNISDVDPKGSIPGFVKNAVAGMRADILKDIAKKINQK